MFCNCYSDGEGRLTKITFPEWDLSSALEDLTSPRLHVLLSKRRWVVQIVVSAVFGAYSGSRDCIQSLIQGLFSIPTSPPSAFSLASALLVFSHGLLSQPQVSLIINDPQGGS